MKVTGIYLQQLDTIEGDTERGHWRRGSFVMDIGAETVRMICLTFSRDELFDLVGGLQRGQRITVDFIPESRSHNEKWFTDLKAFRVEIA